MSADSTTAALRWLGGAKLVSQLANWGLTVLTVRLLSPHDYGLIATAGVFSGVALLLLDGGLGVVLITRSQISQRAIGTIFALTMLLSLAFGVLLALTAPFASWFFDAPLLQPVLLVTSLYMPLAALGSLPNSLLCRSLRFQDIAVSQLFGALFQGLSTFALASFNFGFWSLILGNFFGTTLRVALLWRAAKPNVSPNLDAAEIRPIIKDCGHLLGNRALFYLVSDFDTFLISKFSGVASAGLYSLAKSLTHSLLDQASGLLSPLLLPIFSRDNADGRAAKSFSALIIFVSAIMFPLFWGASLFASTVLNIAFGERWLPLSTPALIFLAILPLRSIFAISDSAVIGSGNASTSYKNMVTWACVMCPIFLLLGVFAPVWMALGWILGFPIVLHVALLRISNTFDLALRAIYRPIINSVIAGAVSWVSALLLANQLGDQIELAFVVKFVTYSLIYLSTYYLLAPNDFRKVVQSVTGVLRPNIL